MGKYTLISSNPYNLLTPHRLKVLSLLGLSKLVTEGAPHIAELRDRKFSGETIGRSRLPE